MFEHSRRALAFLSHCEKVSDDDRWLIIAENMIAELYRFN